MPIKLHRCSVKWFKLGAHPCWKVERELQAKGIAYEPVYGPLSRGKRERVKQLTGQTAYPTIEFEDGSAYREESKDMAATIRAGKLDEKRGSAQVPAS